MPSRVKSGFGEGALDPFGTPHRPLTAPKIIKKGQTKQDKGSGTGKRLGVSPTNLS